MVSLIGKMTRGLFLQGEAFTSRGIMCDIYGKDQPRTLWKPCRGSFSSSFPLFSPLPTPTIFLNSLFRLMLHYPHLLLIGGFSCCIGLSEGKKHQSIICRGKIISVLNVFLRSVIAPSLRTRDADANYSPAVAIDDQTGYASGRKWDRSRSPSHFLSVCLTLFEVSIHWISGL